MGLRIKFREPQYLIENNIAEGFDRNSNKDFTRCLYIAISSCSVLKSMSYHAEQLKGIIQSEKESLLEKANDVSKRECNLNCVS